MPQSGAGTGTGPATLVISSEEDEKVSRKPPLKTPMKSPPGLKSSKMGPLAGSEAAAENPKTKR